ncbi:uncharacterized protein LOC124947589 [Vespa velutina]|uniref:uncharacterized protein LOC124947589 n=1 Tax=Vespa velutina TaxID=202808 RepID=UPI001FB2EC06|nr:uncharacterized protein LOC124947589 [Vespa velutina]
MVVPMKWLKGSVLRSSEQPFRKQSTQEEVKGQRSFKKLFLPSWFLRKSNNSKLNKKFESGQNHSPIWQTSDSYKYFNFKISPKDIKTKAKFKETSEDNSRIYDIVEETEDFIENTKKEITSKPSSNSNEEFNTEIPVVKIENVSITYPRISPCRKLQNLNIVFTSPLEKEPLKLSEELLQKTDPLKTPEYFSMKKPNFYQNNNQKQCCSEAILPDKVTLKNDPPIVSMPPRRRKTFKPRILTTPGGSKTAIFSSTLNNEESLCTSKPSSIMSTYAPNNYIDYQRQQLIELNIKEKKLLALKNLISKKQELLYRLKEFRQFPVRSPTKDLNNFSKDSSSEESDTDDLSNNFFNSTRKSIEMEKIVQNKTRHTSIGLVRNLVNKFDCEKTKSMEKETYKKKSNLDHTFVKMAANALENGDMWQAQQILNERGTSTEEDITIEYSSDYINSTASRFSNKNFNCNDVMTKLSSNSKTYFPNDKIFTFPDSVYPKNMKRRVQWIYVPSNVSCPFLYEKTYKKSRYSTAKFYPIDEFYITNTKYRE